VYNLYCDSQEDHANQDIVSNNPVLSNVMLTSDSGIDNSSGPAALIVDAVK
jgi:hypothetical protein